MPDSNIFNEVRRRDATAAIRGFVYQVDVTLLRWLSLQEDEHLELEAGEDIDRIRMGLVSDGGTFERLCESVKYRSKHLTLRSPEALAALAGFYEHIRNHPTMRLTFRYLSNASIGHEAKLGSSATTAGVDLWMRVQNGTLSGKERESAAEHIRSLLRSARRPDKLNRFTWGRFTAFLKRAPALELLTFIESVEWSVTNCEATAIRLEIEQRLLTERHINADAEKGRAYERLFVEVFELLSKSGRKLLRRTDLALALTRLQLVEVESAVLRRLQTFEKFLSSKLEDISNVVGILPGRLNDLQVAVEDLREARPQKVKQPQVSLEQIEAASSDTRVALEPALLPRLSRSVVFEKYLPAIERGYKSDERRIVVLSAPAGYGKSTLLGEIYDHLVGNGEIWLGLIRCNDLPADGGGLTSSEFDVLLGEALSGTAHPATEICETLAAQHGRGVLLIDTLDLILTPNIVPALRRMFTRLLDVGVTVVVTCRDYDYQAHLEPAREKLASVAEAVDRYTVPRFEVQSEEGEEGEVVRAAELFFLVRPGALAGTDGRQFGRQIVRLSADNQSLEDIIRNPLLLGMLCELFGQTGVVPMDLTVSTLYDTFWEQRVRRGRIDSAASVLAQERQQLCIDVASTLYGFSRERTVDQLPETDVSGLDRATGAQAFNDLLSENILRRSDRGMVSFFHQTFLEYTIARWLVGHRTADEREALISSVLSPLPASAVNWWPVLRQLLVLIDEHGWEKVRLRFANASSNAFRTVCQAAVARRAPNALSDFANLAISLTAVHQQCVIDVLETLPRMHALVAWQTALLLLKEGEWQQAVNAAQLAGRLVSRWQRELGKLLMQAFATVEEREPSEELRQSELKSWLIAALGTTSQGAPDPTILDSLSKEYGRLGFNTKHTVISLHVRGGVAESDRRALLLEAVRWPLPSACLDAVTLLESVLPSILASAPGPFGGTLEEALSATLPDGWWTVQAEVVGRSLASSPQLEIFTEELITSKAREMRRNLAALRAAAGNGAGARLSGLIRSRDAGSLGSDWERIGPLIEAIGTAAPLQRGPLLTWLRPAAPLHLKSLLIPWIVLADGSLDEAEAILLAIRSQPSSDRPKLLSGFVQHAPHRAVTAMGHQILAELHVLYAAAANRKHKRIIELARVQLDKTLAAENADAVDRLLASASSESEMAALSSSQALLDCAPDLAQLVPSRLRPILQSRFLGVRMHGLELLDRMIERRAVRADEMTTALSALQDESNPTALRALCEVLTRWLRSTPNPHESTASFAVTVVGRSIDTAEDAGLIRSALKLLKALAVGETIALQAERDQLTLRLLRCADLEKTRDGEAEMTDLLASLARTTPGFLRRAAEEYLNGPNKVRTGQALVWAIKRVEGRESILLDFLLTDKRIADSVAFQIRKLREV